MSIQMAGFCHGWQTMPWSTKTMAKTNASFFTDHCIAYLKRNALR